jgi:hypothetical protein
MGKLKSLQLKRLLKELDYIESELEYRSELINEADSQFLLEINYFLEENYLMEHKISSKIKIFHYL